MITNVRILTPGSEQGQSGVRAGSDPGSEVVVHANFTVHRFRRSEQVSQFVGQYRYRLRVVDGKPKIALREAILDSQELGSLGAVSFIL